MLHNRLIVFVAIAVALYLPMTNAVESEDENIKSDIGKTLFLVVEATTQSSDALEMLAANITDVLNNVDPNWFSRYVVIGFDSTGVIYHNGTTSAPGVQDLLLSVINGVTTNTDCDLPILEAILNGLSYYTFDPQSIVYVITTAGSSDSNSVTSTFFRAARAWQIELQYILLRTTECNNTMYTTNVWNMEQTAVLVNGTFIPLQSNTDIIDYLYTHLPTLYRTLYNFNPHSGTWRCSTWAEFFDVEVGVKTIYLYTYVRDNVVFSVASYNTTNVSMPALFIPNNGIPLTTLYRDEVNAVQSFNPVDGFGRYVLYIDTSYFNFRDCNYQLRFQGEWPTPLPTSTTTKVSTEYTTATHTETSTIDNTPSSTSVESTTSAETVSTAFTLATQTPTSAIITTPSLSTAQPSAAVSTESATSIYTSTNTVELSDTQT